MAEGEGSENERTVCIVKSYGYSNELNSDSVTLLELHLTESLGSLVVFYYWEYKRYGSLVIYAPYEYRPVLSVDADGY